MVTPTDRGASPVRQVELFDYRIHVGPWLLDEVGRVVVEAASAHSVVVITDEHVAPLHLPAVMGSLRHFLPQARTLFRVVAAGEVSKTRESWGAITDWMLDERCGRDSTIVALGGGVVGDLAGFVAATYMRGIPYVQCPTSLLAMVDASVGGKVGVDTPAGKNLIGAFHQPGAVVVDPTVLQTLPEDQWRSGLAEVIKHGVIADATYLSRVVSLGGQFVAHQAVAWHGDELAALIAQSIEIKADVVRSDEREAGRRQILNFGHTIGHAIESESGFALLHGEAVAIGMTLEAALAERLGIAEASTRNIVEGALREVGLPTECPASFDAESLISRMKLDKKSRAGQVTFALPARVGEMAGAERSFGFAVDDRDIRAVLEENR